MYIAQYEKLGYLITFCWIYNHSLTDLLVTRLLQSKTIGIQEFVLGGAGSLHAKTSVILIEH